METNIHTFQGTILAFWRPVKRTFYLLKWDNISRQWEYEVADPEVQQPFTIHKSSVHEGVGTVMIRVKSSGRRFYNTRIRCCSRFLKRGDGPSIPIAKAVVTPPSARIKREYTAIPSEPDNYLVDVRLWSEVVQAPPKKPKLTPIPRRIAWIIAEDFCKNGETCPISLEEITPITASVTTCFHVFQSGHLNTWFSSGNNTCPVCRVRCVAQEAFEDVVEVAVA